MRAEVYLWERRVGLLADDVDLPAIAFQYAPEWLADGLSISPLNLAWEAGVQWNRDARPFSGLFGVFGDSFPDSWGQMLMDERFRRAGLNPEKVGALERLCYVADRGWGALTYAPDRADTGSDKLEKMDLVEAERSARAAVEGRMRDVLPEVIESGASTGGARPKQRIAISGADPDVVWYGKTLPPAGYEPWILKIETDPRRCYGRVEKAYYALAEEMGLQVPETRLVSASPEHVHHFAVKRFDWLADRRLHCHTLAGMLHRDSHAGSTDYEEFLRAVLTVTENQECVVEAFKRAVFNVSFGVRDDHGKNHAFTMTPDGEWTLSPAYDVMYSRPGVGNGLHRQMPLLGKREGIDRADVESLARTFAVNQRTTRDIFDTAHEVALSWDEVCGALGIPDQRMAEIRDTWEFPGPDYAW